MESVNYAVGCLDTAAARLERGNIVDAAFSLTGAIDSLKETKGWDHEITGADPPNNYSESPGSGFLWSKR